VYYGAAAAGSLGIRNILQILLCAERSSGGRPQYYAHTHVVGKWNFRMPRPRAAKVGRAGRVLENGSRTTARTHERRKMRWWFGTRGRAISQSVFSHTLNAMLRWL